MMITYIVYTIRDDKGNVVYVGMTSYPADARFNAHRLSKKPVGEWIRNRLSKGKDVLFVTEMKWHAPLGSHRCKIIERAASQAERTLIAKFAMVSKVFFNTQHIRGKHPNVKYIELPAAILADKELTIEPEEVINLRTGEEIAEARTA